MFLYSELIKFPVLIPGYSISSLTNGEHWHCPQAKFHSGKNWTKIGFSNLLQFAHQLFHFNLTLLSCELRADQTTNMKTISITFKLQALNFHSKSAQLCHALLSQCPAHASSSIADSLCTIMQRHFTNQAALAPQCFSIKCCLCAILPYLF